MNRIFCIEYNEYNEEFFLFERNFLPVMGIFKTPSYPNSHTTSYPTDPLIQPLSLTIFSPYFSPGLASTHFTPFNNLNPYSRYLIPLDPSWVLLNFPAVSLLSPLDLVVEHFLGGDGILWMICRSYRTIFWAAFIAKQRKMLQLELNDSFLSL